MKKRNSLKKGGDVREDRLSSLSDELLLQILSFLYTKHAVQTCVLSKRWKSLWKSVPCLQFYMHELEMDDYEEGVDDVLRSFEPYVVHVLARRNPVNLVKVRFDCPDPRADPLVVESLISYAVQHNVQILDVGFSNVENPIHLPEILLTCASLTSLKLRDGWNCPLPSIRLPKFLALPALKSLHLSGFRFDRKENDFGSRILSCCPNLETLKLVDGSILGLKIFKIHALNLRKLKLEVKSTCQTFQDGCKFEILAPKLTTFKYVGFARMVCFTGNLTSLDNVYFDACSISTTTEEDFSDLINTFKAFRHSKSLSLSLDTIMVLSTVAVLLDENQLSFTGLKHLKLIRGTMHLHKAFMIPPGYFLLLENSLSNFLKKHSQADIDHNYRQIAFQDDAGKSL